ncbi:MAG: ATP-binding protein, partial [Burkholderiales bacterium]
NAWRHSQKRLESIRIRVGRGNRPDRMNIDIIDDGPGVAESLQAELFEPFFTTSEGGTGLGLYIAREIAAANGATLDYVGEGPGGHFRIECRGADGDQA